jgi:hypothetical protein
LRAGFRQFAEGSLQGNGVRIRNYRRVDPLGGEPFGFAPAHREGRDLKRFDLAALGLGRCVLLAFPLPGRLLCNHMHARAQARA